MRNRRFIALGLAVAIALSLSGCSALDTIGSIGNEAFLTAQLEGLSSELEAIPGIEGADFELTLQADFSYVIGVSATSTGLTEENATKALAAATTAITGGTLAEHSVRWFSLTGDDSLPLIDVHDWGTFPVAVIPDEIAYLYALREATGVQLSIALSAPSDAEVNYFRAISSQELPSATGLAAARAVPDTDAEGKGWSFDGVSMDGAIIPVDVEPVAVQVAAIDGVSLSWIDAFSGFDLNWNPSDPAHGDDFTALPEWPAVVALMKTTLDSDTGFSLLQVTKNNMSLALHSGDCGEPQGTPDESALAEQFAAAGIQLSPGYCLP